MVRRNFRSACGLGTLQNLEGSSSRPQLAASLVRLVRPARVKSGSISTHSGRSSVSQVFQKKKKKKKIITSGHTEPKKKWMWGIHQDINGGVRIQAQQNELKALMDLIKVPPIDSEASADGAVWD
jgi:hypothetical protein